ncbi:MAG: DEAD/DEAH box helicase [Candidatus Parvarchaeota archaeon]|nr:DEAD/DEAH box helicase [Candidatus Jingweiarchaeum tengchongense]MCW1298605.1 DEAD/DEAH box helicase [Candidatus Jingweiarchaeum tengchongense]MCW1300451.1 DEAD/DEAH box helicase [Candidatus Jingweiarchaeum tengchongense]MCW1309511.1 DEAD/DEAH box helicase [Candidatus Jingweiarchaeum tengchongense]MCW1310300.1 DEAD/DEAH box helicase [Candidatus Jingweiarchaeum tengchongense]
MKLVEIKDKIPSKLYKVLEERFEELRPPQEIAIKKGLLEGKNIVVSSPTASGKTIVAEIACIKNILEGKGKAVYVVPLKALANEKFEDFKKFYEKIGIKIAISIGDLDSSDPWLEKYDLIIVTSEKLDSLIRHGANWLSEIGTIVIDEIHLLDDISRGPTLEVLITRLREIVSNAQIIALSATIKNASDIATWLGAEIVESDYRPVKLFEGIFYKNKIELWEKKKKVAEEKINEKGKAEFLLIKNTLEKRKQVLFFLSSRRFAESLAKKSCNIVDNFLSIGEKVKLNEIADKVLNALERPTEQCEKLSECIRHGVAFHHAGLLYSQRIEIENAFRKHLIKVVCCTPTLSLGVNLPSHTCVIRDLKRYSEEYGYEWISVLEFKQYGGRAGRPGYDTEGRALAIASSEGDREEIIDRYIKGEPEEITSKLSVEPLLRMHLLALIASFAIRNIENAKHFFSKTFYALQYKRMDELEEKILRIIRELQQFGFIEINERKIAPTQIGKRVSELYIDPLSAHKIILALKKTEKVKTREISYLQVLCNTVEMYPLLSVRPREFMEIQNKLIENEEFLLQDEPNPWDYEYEDFIRSFKTSLLFYDWINEKSEEEILERYRVAPGELRTRLVNMDWLIYASEELARLLGMKNCIKDLVRLRLRIQHGVKEELLNLVKLEQIGRVRARILYDAGIKNIRDIKKVSFQRISRLLGEGIAAKIKKQVGEEVKISEKKFKKPQTEILDFEGR